MVRWCLYWFPTIVLRIFPMDVVLWPSFSVELCSVGTWSNPVHIFWCLPLVLATSNSFWAVPTSYVVLDVPHPLNHGFSSGFPPWSSCCSVHRLFLPCIPLRLLPRLDHRFFPMLEQLHSLLLRFFWSLWESCFLPLSCFLLLLQLLLLSFIATICPSRVEHLCCLPWCSLDLFLKGYLPLCLSFPVYVSMWNRNLVT